MELPQTLHEPEEWMAPSSPLPPVQTDSKTMDLDDDVVTDPLQNAIAFAFSGIEKEDLAEPDYSAEERLELIAQVVAEMQAIADNLAAKKEPEDSQMKRLLAKAYAQSVRNFPSLVGNSDFKKFARMLTTMTEALSDAVKRAAPSVKPVSCPPPTSLTWMDGTKAFTDSMNLIEREARRIDLLPGNILQHLSRKFLLYLEPTEQLFY